jgi:hypothetical protein
MAHQNGLAKILQPVAGKDDDAVLGRLDSVPSGTAMSMPSPLLP